MLQNMFTLHKYASTLPQQISRYPQSSEPLQGSIFFTSSAKFACSQFQTLQTQCLFFSCLPLFLQYTRGSYCLQQLSNAQFLLKVYSVLKLSLVSNLLFQLTDKCILQS